MEMDATKQLYFPAQVRAVGDETRIATLTQILRSNRALDPSILEEHPPFFWRAEISNTRLDAYFTHMLLSTLRNFAQEAAAGVAFLPGHDHRHLPIGGSLTGELSEAANPLDAASPAPLVGTANAVSSGNIIVVRSDFYTLSNMEIGTIKTNGLISSIKGGLTRDNSVGWYGGKLLCDIDGLDYWRGRCPHIAGLVYREEKDGVVQDLLATVGIDDAHLAEVSGVYDGATPGAMIEKVYEMASAGELSASDVRHIQVMYRLDKETTQRMLALPAVQKKHAGVDIRSLGGQKPGKEGSMTVEEIMAGQLTEIREILSEARFPVTEDVPKHVRELATALSEARARVTELEPRAADGETYRNDLVAAALAEGVRAYGEKFASEIYERQLRAAPLDVIKQMRDDWKRIGDANFPGGRSTNDADPAQPNAQAKETELRAPAYQYK